jgi:hypothetical protein
VNTKNTASTKSTTNIEHKKREETRGRPKRKRGEKEKEEKIIKP